MKNACLIAILTALLLFCTGFVAAQGIICPPEAVLEPLFRDAQRVDLRTSNSASVVALRDVVKIPPPDTAVLVKRYARTSLPPELEETFASGSKGDSTVSGVTMYGRYIVIIRSGFAKEDADVLNHELVHAYISLASPEPLPFWFQEASAVHFSTDTARRVYGKPSDERAGQTEAKVVEITKQYQQKLQSFHYLMGRVGKAKFYDWYSHAVQTGVVDSRPLLGLSETDGPVPDESGKPMLIGIIVAAMLIVLAMIIHSLISAKKEKDLY